MGSCLGKLQKGGGAANQDGEVGTVGSYKAASPKASKKSKKAPAFEDTIEYQLGLPEDPEAQQKGCYLVFDPASGGTLKMIWSEKEIECWAFFFPRTPVAGFKYKQNGGATELIRNIAVNKKGLFSGMVQFIKHAYDHDGVLRIYTDRADFWFINEQEMVNQIPDELFEAKTVSAVAVIPHLNQCYKGVHKMPEQQFIDLASGEGGVTWKPLRR